MSASAAIKEPGADGGRGTASPVQPKRRKGSAAIARAGAALMRAIDVSLDAQLGADECAARLRRYVADHDAPADDASAFGRLCEVIFAQGIGFAVVARKRDELVRAFARFEPAAVAALSHEDVRRLMNEPIIRNEAKIRACIENARRWCGVSGGYFSQIASAATNDDPTSGWPALVTRVAADFVRINEVGAHQTLKRWGFFTAFGHPGARRVLERLALIDREASCADCQLAIGAIARVLSRDAYAVEGELALFAALGPCKVRPVCSRCALSGRCPSSSNAG